MVYVLIFMYQLSIATDGIKNGQHNENVSLTVDTFKNANYNMFRHNYLWDLILIMFFSFFLSFLLVSMV